MRRLGAAAALALVGVGVAATPAGAATVAASLDPRVRVTQVDLAYDAAPGEANRLSLTPSDMGPGAVEVRDPAAVISTGRGCTRVDEHSAVCSPETFRTPEGVPAGFTRVVARLGDGADQVDSGLSDPPAVTLLGQAGADVLRGGPAFDRLDGGTGGDAIDGGAGSDTLIEGGEAARDDLAGGSGADRLDYRGRRGAVSVDLSRGRGADGDRLRGIEGVTGGNGGDRLVGNAAPNRLEGAGGDDVLLGGRGRDVLVGGQGRDRVRCGSGGDFVERVARSDRLASDCERVIVEGSQPQRFRLFISQPLRAGRSGTVEVRLVHAGSTQSPSFEGRVLLRFKGLLPGRPSRLISLGPGERAVARIGLVDAALSRLMASRRLTVQVVINDTSFTTTLRAPLSQRGTGGGTPA